MTDGDILRIFGLNTSKLALGVSVWIPTLLFIIGLSNLTELLNTISGTDPLPNGVTSYLYILLFFLPSAVLGVLLAEFYDYLLYQYLKSTFNNSKQSFTWWCYPFLSLILPIVFITLIFFWTTFNPKFHLGWTIFFIGWTILLITIFYLVFWKKFLSLEDSNFEFFELAYPWDSWDDPALTKYRDILSTRFYLISSIVTTLSWIGFSSLRNVPAFSFVNLTFLPSYDIDGRTPYLIVFFLILLLIFLLTSLRQKAKKKKDRDMLSLTKSLENSEIFREIRERISRKNKSISFFAELESPVQFIETIEEYTEIYRHNFKNNCRLPTYLNLITIIHINVSASLRIKEVIEKHFPRNENETNPKMEVKNLRSTVPKGRRFQYSEDLAKGFESVLEVTMQSSEELKEKNYEQSVLYLFFQFRRLVHIIEGYYIGSSTDEEEPLTKEEEERLKELSKSENIRVRKTVARNPKIPLEVLKELAKDKSPDVRTAVAENPSIPVEVFKALAKDKSEKVRITVARSQNTPTKGLKIYMKYKREDIRKVVAINRSMLEEVFGALAKDKGEKVRIAVAENPYTPEDVLEGLAKDKSEKVRIAAAEHPYTPEDVLEVLAKDKSEKIRIAIARNSYISEKVFDELVKDESERVRIAVAEHPYTPEKVFDELVKDDDPNVRIVVAENPNTSEDVLEGLATDDDPNVRIAVAENPNASEDVLEGLATDDDPNVRIAVAENPNTLRKL